MSQAQDIVLPKKLFPFIMRFIKKYGWFFIIYQILCLSLALENTLWPYVFGQLIDKLSSFPKSSGDIWHYIRPEILMVISLFLLFSIMNRGSGLIYSFLYPKFEASIRMDMFKYVQDHSYKFFSDNLAGKVANKIADMPRSVNVAIDLVFTIFIPTLLAIIISLGIFYNLNKFFAIILGIWVFIHLSICFLTAKRCKDLSLEHAERRSVLQGRIVDNISNTGLVRAFARKFFEIDFLNFYQKMEVKAYKKSMLFIEYVKIALWILNLIFMFSIIYLMIIKYQASEITIGDITLILNTAFNINFIVWWTGIELPLFFNQIGAAEQALSIITPDHEVQDKEDAKELVVTNGKIVFDNVSFHYNDGNKIFSKKSVLIKPKSKIGLVGFSGSGKTTFANLIMRYFDVENGAIKIDNQDIADVTQESLRENITIIPQNPIMFHRSIYDNIAYGDIFTSEDKVIEASKKANCHEFIMNLPGDYSYVLGERGDKLSGGQKQRIAIARAFLINSPILILDEATSSLDTITEKQIQDSLSELMHDKTTIIIAHRLSTLVNVDRILVFKDGEIIEDGSHEELIVKDGHYAQLWHLQTGGFVPNKER